MGQWLEFEQMWFDLPPASNRDRKMRRDLTWLTPLVIFVLIVIAGSIARG